LYKTNIFDEEMDTFKKQNKKLWDISHHASIDKL